VALFWGGRGAGSFDGRRAGVQTCEHLLNQGQVVRLQRWVKTLLQRKRAKFHAQFRMHGLFALLSDDTFDLLVRLVFIGVGRKSSVVVVFLDSRIPKRVASSQ